MNKFVKVGPRWATTATTAAENFSQAIQAPSPTHPGTTYPVRVSPHSDDIGDRSEGSPPLSPG